MHTKEDLNDEVIDKIFGVSLVYLIPVVLTLVFSEKSFLFGLVIQLKSTLLYRALYLCFSFSLANLYMFL